MNFSITAKQNVSSIGVARSTTLPQKLFLALILGSLSGISFLESVAVAKPVQSSTLPPGEKVDRMFSSDIQAALNACAKQGGVNLAAGADRDGSIICGNGWRKSPVRFITFVNTWTDFDTALVLSGFQAGMKSNPNYKPERFSTVMNSLETSGKLRRFVQGLVAKPDLLPKGSTQSANFLTDRILQRLHPFLQSSTKFENLLGTSDEYGVIADNFCPAPGISPAQAKKLTPNLDSVQMFAICFQESGVGDAIAQGVRHSNSAKR